MKKWFILGFMFLFVLIISACSNDETTTGEEDTADTTETTNNDATVSDEKVKIEFWHAMSGANQAAIDKAVADYNASQEQYEVEALFQGSYEESLTKLRSVGGTSDAPAIMQVFEVGTKYMIENGYVEPVQTFIDQDNYDVSQLEENILNYYTVDGQLYSMPFNSSTPVMLYNKDAFKKAGLDPENPPQTFEEVIAVASKLSNDDMKGFAILLYGWFFEEMLATQGGLYVDADNGRTDQATQALFNGEEGLRIFEFLKEMNDAGTLGNFGSVWDDIRTAFVSGQVAMYLDSSAGIADIAKNAPFEVGAAYIPYSEKADRNGVIIGGASLWMMNGISKEEQAGAWDFMKYLQTPEVQAQWHVSTGYFAINPAAYEQDIVKERWTEYPQLQVTVNQLQDTKPSTATQGALISVFPESREHVVTAIEELYQGGDPQAVLDKAAESTNRAIEIANKTSGN
ncbi:ABC transporter substrate-binding protein [Lysinibacillus sp. LZ02]|uniref:ABC transporter substrate-binding protein n=1 Tax=Lysinibacillus sp. LZ02 TaxID=3420668 RepID=UPI003D35AD03